MGDSTMKTFYQTAICLGYLFLGFWVIEQAETTLIKSMNSTDILICAFGTLLIISSLVGFIIMNWTNKRY